ncbi:hypothetical protein NKG99_31600 [Mesorhizobium sp. M1409]|uniref:hypothetical protein n=1 Tax=unclassified Mesorhizobium TaxID=325217 RepID=UPI0033378ED1
MSAAIEFPENILFALARDVGYHVIDIEIIAIVPLHSFLQVKNLLGWHLHRHPNSQAAGARMCTSPTSHML